MHLCGTSQPFNKEEKIVKIGLIKFSLERGNMQSEDFCQDDQRPLFRVKGQVSELDCMLQIDGYFCIYHSETYFLVLTL